MGKFLKKNGLLLLSIVFVLIVVIVVLIGYKAIQKANDIVAARDEKITQLQYTLDNIGDVQTGYVVNRKVRAGEAITAEMINEVTVPIKLGITVITDRSQIENKYFRISLNEGSVLTADNVSENQVDNSSRYLDVVIDELPVGIQVGDYIDVRITFPFGEDFVALSCKKIVAINSGVLKLEMNEGEIYTYNSLLVDKVIYGGAKIYAVQYVDIGSQTSAEVFYPINNNIAAIAEIDPNILNAVKQEMILKRAALDTAMGGGIDMVDTQQYEALTQEIESVRNRMQGIMTDAQKELERRIEQEQEEQNNG